MSLIFHSTPQPKPDQIARWRKFIARCPGAHYTQDPAWAEINRHGTGPQARRPHFFWCEEGGDVRLTAVGIRRGLPIPGRVFWEFDGGPTVLEPSVLDQWLGWLPEALGREVARLTLQPAAPLDAVGDQMETMLDAHGFVRRRGIGIWSTLVVDIKRPEEELLASFRRETRRLIRKSRDLGVVVETEDTPMGWATLVDLDAELATRKPIRPIDAHTVQTISRTWLVGGSGGALFVARHDGEPLAALLLILYQSRATPHAMPASRRHTKLPTTHLLLWEAMRWAKTQGCTEFDLGGYSLSARPGEPLWHVNVFKQGFAPRQVPQTTVAVHERVFSPLIVSSAAALRRWQTQRRLRRAPERPDM